MATIRTVLLNSNLTDASSLAAKYDAEIFEIVMLNGGSAQIQAYLDTHGGNGANMTIVSPSGGSDGLFTSRVVFIDPSVADYQTLVAGMPAGCTVVVLDASRDGIQQMRDYLANNVGQVGAIDIVTNIASLDVVSHGGPGEIMLGSTVLNAETMGQYSRQLAEIGSHMTSNGDILLYGCDVAAGAEGQAFIFNLAQATGADVAASTDLTGGAAAGGDWVLEASAGGAIEAAALSVENYDVLLPVTSASITAISNDSGAADFITNDPTLTFSGKYTSNNGTTNMYLWVDGVQSGSVSVSPNKTDTAWSHVHAASLSEGAHAIVINTNQNNATSGVLASRTVTIDTSTAAPVVALTTDSGTVGDKITNVGTLQVSGMESGATVQYSNNGGAFVSTFTAVEGANAVIVRATDVAGNTADRNFSFTLDTTATQPSVSLSVDSTDGGAGHGTDLVTNNAALTVSALESGASRTYAVDGGGASGTYVAPVSQGSHTVVVTDKDAAGNSASRTFTFTLDTLADPEGDLKVTVVDTLVGLAERSAVAYSVAGLNSDAVATVVFSDGVNSVTGSNGVVNLSSLKDGAISVSISAKDFAGNTAAGAGAALTLDTSITSPTLALAVDSSDGGSGHGADGRTNNAALVFSALDADATRAIQVDGKSVASYDASALADGPHTVTVTDTDAAGNTASKSLTFNVDRTIAAPAISLENDTTDLGAGHGADGVTSDGSLKISALESDASKRVINVDGKDVASYDQSLLGDGAHTVTVTDTDWANNTSTNTLKFTIDRTIATPAISLSNDTTDGASGHGADGRTSDASLTISALEAGASTRVINVDGKDVSSYDQSALADGEHTVTVTDTDWAGNKSSNSVKFTVDRSIDTATIALSNDSSDGGAGHGSDGRTNDASLTISALEADASTRVINVDGKDVSSYDQSALADGEHTVTVTDTDWAGNKSSNSVKFTVDLSIATATIALSNDTSDGGAGHGSDGRTSDASLTISALEADASTRVINVDGKDVSSYNQSALADGEHTVTVTDTDWAGNKSSNSVKFTVDRSIATATIALSNDTSDGGAGHGSDGRTNDASLTISALEADASTRVINLDGKDVSSYDQSALADGEHTVTVTDTDWAGNKSSNSVKFTVDRSIDTATIALSNDSSDGGAGHGSDGRTNDASLTISALEVDASTRVINVDGKDVSSYNQSALADGEHIVTVTDTDWAGNKSSNSVKFTVDRSIATATIALSNDTGDGGAGHGSDGRTSDASLTISALEADASTRVITVDGKDVSSYDQSALADGEHTVTVTDTDWAGNKSSNSVKFTVDRSIATATIALSNDTSDGGAGHGSDGRTSDASLTISALEADASTRVINVDGKDFSSYDQSALSDGEHTVTVTDTDWAGNKSSNSVKFTVDRSIATATIALSSDTSDGGAGHGTDGRTNDASLTISALEADASTRVINVDGKDVSSYDQAALADGEHTVTVTDTDWAGNKSSNSVKFTVDRSIATATIALSNDTTDGGAGHGTDGRTSDASLTISTLESDASTRVINVDGKDVSSYDQSALADGEHTVTVTDTDWAGNKSSNSVKFTVDRSIATATIALSNDTSDGGPGYGADGRTSDASLTISALEADASTRVINVDGKNVSSYDQSALSDGEHTVTLTDTDWAGNKSSNSVKFTVDRSIATATIALSNDTSDGGAGHGSDSRTSDASLIISALEADASTRVINVDGKDVSSYDQASLADGEHTVTVIDTDWAGNKSSNSVKFTVDRSIATATIALSNDTSDGGAGHGTDGLTNDASLTISALEADASNRVINVDGKDVSSYNQSALADGEHTVTVTDTDWAGNKSSNSLKFTVDRTITATTVALALDSTDGAPGHASDKLTNNAVLVFSPLDTDATRSYRIDGKDASSYDPSSLADGIHTVEAIDIDIAGNKSSNSITFALDTKLTTPTLSLAQDTTDGGSGHDSDKVTSNANINFNAKDSDANRVIVVDGVVGAYNPADLADGSHTITVTDTDAAGNSQSSSLKFTLDTNAPITATISLVSDTSDGAAGHDSDKVTSNAALNLSAVEAGATRSFSINGGAAAASYVVPTVDGSYSVAVKDTDIAGNSTTTTFSFMLDQQADLGADLATLVADQSINKAERIAAAYSVQGLDADANAKVAFTDSANNTVFGSNGLVDLSSLADGTITVTVGATDFSGNTASGALSSLVLDTTGPTFTSAATATIAENAAANTAVYTAQASDVHGAQYSLLANNSDDAGAFTVGADGIVRMNAGADFETKASYKFTVVATDSFGNASQKAVTLAVTDVNEAPDTAPIALNTIENASILIPVLPDYAFDPDAGDVLTVSSVSSVMLNWAPESSSTAIVNPVTKQQLSLSQVYATAAITSDGKGITVSPSAEFDWATTGQKVMATLSYVVKDKAGLATQGTITLAIWGSTSDKGKNWAGSNGADTVVGELLHENVLQGANGNDSLTGGNITDALYGGNGDDRLFGGNGIDYLYGDSGNDTLDGGAERDMLFGGKGNDVLYGGLGADYFIFEPQLGSDKVMDFNMSAGDKLFFLDFFTNAISVHDFVGKYAKVVGNDTVISLQGGNVTVVGVNNLLALESAIAFSLGS